MLAGGLLLFALLVWRALRTFLLTRRVADLLVVVGLIWLGTALVAALTMLPTDLGWWLGHMFELDGILVVGIPVALDLARTAQSRPLAGDIHAADLVASEEIFLGSHVRAHHPPPGREGRVHGAAHPPRRHARRFRSARRWASRRGGCARLRSGRSSTTSGSCRFRTPSSRSLAR